MAEGEASRKVTLTFGGDAFAGGRVPLTLLAEKLKALQSLLFHAAATVTHDKAARRGQWTNRYREAVELRFADSRPGSLVIEAELAGVRPGLFDRADLGLESLDLAYEVAQSVEDDGSQRLAERIPDRQERLLMLRSIEQLSPRPDEAYDLTFANGAATHPGVRLTGATRLRSQVLIHRELLDERADMEEVGVVGVLTKIHFDTAPQMLSVRVSVDQEVPCYYDESLREQVANLCPGSVVQVTGFAVRAPNGRIRRLEFVTSVESVSMEPIRIARFEHGGRAYNLKEAVPFNIEYTDGVWAYSNDALGIRGYATKRDEAVRELHEAFDFAYRDIGLAAEDDLIGKAIDMRREFLRLVPPQTGVRGT